MTTPWLVDLAVRALRRKRHAASLMPDDPKDALAVLEYSRPLVEEFLTTEITPEAAERAQLEIERPWFARKGAP